MLSHSRTHALKINYRGSGKKPENLHSNITSVEWMLKYALFDIPFRSMLMVCFKKTILC